MARTTERRTQNVFAGRGISIAEAALAAVVVVLAILGLAGVLSSWMTQIGVIVVGLALMLHGAALSAHYIAASRTLEGREASAGSGVSAEFVAGLGAVVLGVLALAGVSPEVMVPVAVVLLGGGLLFGGGLVAGAQEVESGRYWASRRAHRTGQAALGAGTAESLVGAGALVLGILSLVGVQGAEVLPLVALLGLGVGLLLSGTSLAGRLGRLGGQRERPFHGIRDHHLREP